MAHTVCRLARSGGPVPGVVDASVAARARRRGLVERRPWRGVGVAGFLAAGGHDVLTGLRRVAGAARIARILSRGGGSEGGGCQPHAHDAGYGCGCEKSLHLSSLTDVGPAVYSPSALRMEERKGLLVGAISRS